MFFSFFDSCFSLHNISDDYRFFTIFSLASFSLIALLIFVKNLIFYFHIYEHFFWVILILSLFDLSFFIHRNRTWIEHKLSFLSSFLPISKNNNNTNADTDTISNYLSSPLTPINDDEFSTSIIV